MPKPKPVATLRKGDVVVKVYDVASLKDVLNLLEGRAEPKDVVDLSELCRGLTAVECLEKIRKEVPDYRNKLYRIDIEF